MPMQDDEYELMPRTELEYLRKEVEKLKRNPLGDTQASVNLLDSMNKLSLNILKLNAVLEGANDEMVKAFNETAMQEQLRKMLEQQERLAKGIVAVAELVKDLQAQQQKELPEIEQIISQSRAAQPSAAPQVQINAQALAQDLQAPPLAAKSRNPFDEDPGRPEYKPIMNEPLPRPGGVPPPLAMPASPPPPVSGAIPDSDIPPPPPKRY